MSEFLLEILTPEKRFFSGNAQAVTVTASDGELTVLKGHMPFVGALAIGSINIKQNGAWRSAINSEGFMEVGHDSVRIFVQACEWPEEIDIKRAQAAKERAEARLHQKQTVSEYRYAQISLARAMNRLRVKK